MVVQSLQSALEKLKENLETVSSQGIDMGAVADPEKTLYDFKTKRQQYLKDGVQRALLEVKRNSAELMRAAAGSKDEQAAYDISVQIRFLEEYYKTPEKAMPIIVKIQNLAKELSVEEQKPAPRKSSMINFDVDGLPDDIKPEVSADIDELSKCFASGCYRSCVILCGRVLETCLHRKYFDATGHDILEKSPGIGLGNLVGKLKDKNIAFDPGLSQQIHLINQVRIFSVHKKQEAFYPSKDQTQAIILYTLDVIRRLL
ncbi:hypothetical protein ACFL96_13895 [Thermoproteota archaeon]